MHRFLLLVHRWVALAATAILLVVALTGGALVFEGAMDRGLHPGLWRVAPGTGMLSIDTIFARAVAAVPGPPPTGLTLSPVPGRAFVVQSGPNQIFVNPYTGAVLGERTAAEWDATLPRRLHVLHVSLMSGTVGGAVVGAATVLAFVLVLTGIVIWWRDKLWRVRWSASWKRVIFDLHHTLGIVAAVVLLLISGTGMTIHYKPLMTMLSRLDQTPPPQVPAQPPAPAGAVPLSADSLYRASLAGLPGAQAMFLVVPPKPTQAFVAAMRFPEDHPPGGRSRVYVDRYRGTVLLATSTRQAELGTRLTNELRSAHTGDLFGKPTEAIWLAAAIVLAMQGVTGVTMWWNGRPARAALRRRSADRGVDGGGRELDTAPRLRQ